MILISITAAGRAPRARPEPARTRVSRRRCREATALRLRLRYNRFPWHPEHHARSFILRHGMRSGLPHLQQPRGTVGAHPCEQHAGRVFSNHLCHRMEQHIHCWSLEAHLRAVVQAHPERGGRALHRHVKIPRRDSASPRRNSSPSLASRTSIAHTSFSRLANASENTGGMCWTMAMGGHSAGIPRNKARMASVPPVEAPMAISRVYRGGLPATAVRVSEAQVGAQLFECGRQRPREF